MWNKYGGNTLYNWKANSIEEVKAGLAKTLDLPAIGPFIENFVKIGNPPAGNSSEYRTDLDDLERWEANINVLAKEAKIKLFSGKSHEITEEEQSAFEYKFPRNISNDPIFRSMIGKELGATDLLMDYMNAKDKKKKLVILKEITRLMGMRNKGTWPKDLEILAPADVEEQ